MSELRPGKTHGAFLFRPAGIFRYLLALVIIAGILISGLLIGYYYSLPKLVNVLPGQTVACFDRDSKELKLFNTAGYHLCRGEWSLYQMYKETSLNTTFPLKDGVEITIRTVFAYHLPEEPLLLVPIYLEVGSETDQLIYTVVSANVRRVFSEVDSGNLLQDSFELIDMTQRVHERSRWDLRRHWEISFTLLELQITDWPNSQFNLPPLGANPVEQTS